MSKTDEVRSAIVKSNIAMSAVWQTVKIHGNQGEMELLKEAIALCEAVLLRSDEHQSAESS